MVCNELKVVKCPICGKVLKTRANYFFRCCGIAHNLKNNQIGLSFSMQQQKFTKEKFEKTGENAHQTPISPVEIEVSDDRKIELNELLEEK